MKSINLMVAVFVVFWGNTIAQSECHFYLDVTGNDSPNCGTTTMSACKTLGQVSMQIGSCDNTVIHIASGIYTGYGNRNISFIFTGKNLLLQASTPGHVIFDAENKMDILSLQIDNGIVQFQGITFARGRSQQHGGCVSIISELEGHYQFSDCWFVECSALSEGGAFYAKVVSPSMFVRVAFFACTAVYGGAAMFDGGNIVIKDCIFRENTAGGNIAIGGGVFYAKNANVSVEDSHFQIDSPEPQPQPQRQPEPHPQPQTPSPPHPQVQPQPPSPPHPQVQPQPQPPSPPHPHVQPEPTPEPAPDTTPDLPLPIVLGIVIGSVGTMILMAVGLVCWRRYQQRKGYAVVLQ